MPSPRLLFAALCSCALTFPSVAAADGWSTGFPVSAPGASSPSVAADGAGGVTAIWLRAGVVEAASRGASGSFPAPQALSAAGSS
ncbi:MAG: hypothetical protein M3389_00760, partial [Actinomycetota bacterium]|nr:hypothetical protein [Actinomycetota bacterium]